MLKQNVAQYSPWTAIWLGCSAHYTENPQVPVKMENSHDNQKTSAYLLENTTHLDKH